MAVLCYGGPLLWRADMIFVGPTVVANRDRDTDHITSVTIGCIYALCAYNVT